MKRYKEFTKSFLVWRKSENTNSFGLYKMYLMAKDGESYTSCASMYNVKEVGSVINGKIILDKTTGTRVGQAQFIGHELTERLSSDAPQDVINEVWKLEAVS